MTSNFPKLGNISPLIPAGDDVEAAIAFYEQKLGFKAIHTEGDPVRMAIVERDGATLFLVKNGDKHVAEWTSLRIQVDGIEQLYEEFQAKDSAIIHPNGQLEIKPWGPKEFIVLDLAGVCLTFYEFPT
jgi:catechol 2,3-dioxygenase-like lactoylglutathione lyase family enzyme